MPNKLTPTLSFDSLWICCYIKCSIMNKAHTRKPYRICHICKYIILKNSTKQLRIYGIFSTAMLIEESLWNKNCLNKVCHSLVTWSWASSLTSQRLSFFIDENRNNICLSDLLWELKEITYVEILNRASGILQMFNNVQCSVNVSFLPLRYQDFAKPALKPYKS